MLQVVGEKRSERQQDVWGLPEMQELRQDVGKDIASRRAALGLCTERLGKAANKPKGIVELAEKGFAFDGAHQAVCDLLEAMERVESIKDNTSALKIV
jgi:ribosome-binding protein aMBF1 (putative translation factor)